MGRREMTGKNVVITGASSGIGKACAYACYRNGASIHLLGRNTGALKNILAELGGEGSSWQYADMRKPDEFEAIIDAVISKYGRIDGFVHSAGYQITSPIAAMRVDQYLDNYLVNVLAAFELMRLLTRRKATSESGFSAVLISSVMSVAANAGLTSYCATKAALVGGARAMAVELARRGIRVNCVSPGTVADTDMTVKLQEQLAEQEFAEIVGEYPMGLGSTEDIAQTCIYLLSDKAKWITGQNIIIDGGYSAR